MNVRDSDLVTEWINLWLKILRKKVLILMKLIKWGSKCPWDLSQSSEIVHYDSDTTLSGMQLIFGNRFFFCIQRWLVTSPEDCSLAWAKLGSLKRDGNDWKPAGNLDSVPKTEIKPWGRLLGKIAQHMWRNGKNILFRIISVATL